MPVHFLAEINFEYLEEPYSAILDGLLRDNYEIGVNGHE
jgi:hypothetical protein